MDCIEDNPGMELERDLGIKGFCFRGFKDNAVVAQKLLECGVDRIDLSKPQVDFRNPALHDPAIAIYRKAGVVIVGIGVVSLEGDADDRQYFEFCRKAGCRTISFTGKPATFDCALQQAQRWADEYDMRLAIHNHGGKDWLGNSTMLRHVLASAGPRVGLCIDTAWCIQAGEDPIKWAGETFAGRVFAVHYKDFEFDSRGKHRDVIVGDGSLDLPAFVAMLRETGFDGPAVIEYEGDVDNPVPALQQCVQRLKPVLARR